MPAQANPPHLLLQDLLRLLRRTPLQLDERRLLVSHKLDGGGINRAIQRRRAGQLAHLQQRREGGGKAGR